MRTTLSKLHIGHRVVRVSARLVGILLHSCTVRQSADELQVGLQAVLSERRRDFETRWVGPVRIVDGRDSAEADPGAISYECWTELDFSNELKGDR